MKLKPELNRKTLVKITGVVLLLLLLPFSPELLLLIDVGGLDFAITFLLLYLGSSYRVLVAKWDQFKTELRSFLVFVQGLYMLEARVFAPHAALSAVIFSLSCSLFFTCALWLPVMLASSDLFL